MNREGKFAQKAAKAYGADLYIGTRTKTHYIEIMPFCSNLVGSGSQYHHAHSYGFHKSFNLNKYSAVFGGLYSDALLKGARIRKTKLSNKLPLVGEIINKSFTLRNVNDNNRLFTDEVIKELTIRRNNHYNYIRQFRTESTEEWFELWPSSMNKIIPNLHANRRLFKSYEPFLSNGVVKISASVPQSWKLNRRLFHLAIQPLLKPTKWMFHSDGRLPYFSWRVNSFIQFFYKLYKKFGTKLGIIKGNQGPWGEWKVVVNSREWKESIKKYGDSFNEISNVFEKKDIMEILTDNNVNYFERVNLMQVLYHLTKIK